MGEPVQAEKRDEDKYPEILLDLRDGLEEILVEGGAEPGQAADMAMAAAERIRMRWSGRQLYIPKAEEWEQYKRNLEIYRKFDGSNYGPLALEYELSERTVYTIVARMRSEEIARRQMKLFK